MIQQFNDNLNTLNNSNTSNMMEDIFLNCDSLIRPNVKERIDIELGTKWKKEEE